MVCVEREARLDVGGCEVGEIVQHLRNGHATVKIIENVSNGDTRAAEASLAAADARINRDAFPVVQFIAVVFWRC